MDANMETPTEEPDFKCLDLQELVNISNFLLKVDSAKQYGLLEGGPVINPDKCIHYIEWGKRLNIFPDEDFIMPELFQQQPNDTAAT